MQLAVDLDPDAVAWYRANHLGVPVMLADVASREVLSRVVAAAPDLLMASPPCQGFSDARRRFGDLDRHAVLRDQILHTRKVIDAARPRYVVVENVPNAEADDATARWRESMRSMGYALRTITLDALAFGVPQTRVCSFELATSSNAQRDAQSWGDAVLDDASVVDDVFPREDAPAMTSMESFAPGPDAPGSWRPIDELPPNARARVERLMWRPRDYAAAMGMADFKIPKAASLTARLCGNAVCPAVMAAIVRAIKMHGGQRG